MIIWDLNILWDSPQRFSRNSGCPLPAARPHSSLCSGNKRELENSCAESLLLNLQVAFLCVAATSYIAWFALFYNFQAEQSTRRNTPDPSVCVPLHQRANDVVGLLVSKLRWLINLGLHSLYLKRARALCQAPDRWSEENSHLSQGALASVDRHSMGRGGTLPVPGGGL